MTDLEPRLRNWGRWCLWRARQGCAASLEGGYRSPQRWEAPPVNPPPELDPKDGIVLESAVCALPIFDHALLRAWHVTRWKEGDCIVAAKRAASMPRSLWLEFDPAYASACGKLEEQLCIPAVVRKDRARALVRKILGLEDLQSTKSYVIVGPQFDETP